LDQYVSPAVSVVMVSYRTGPVLFSAIESVLAAPDVNELVLVDHGNPARIIERLEKMAENEPRLKLIHTGSNLGFSRGCNIGARAAHGEHLLFLNPDTVLTAGSAARMSKTGLGLSEPWIVGARLIDKQGAEQRGARRGELTLSSAIAGYLGLSRMLPWLRDVHREHEPLPAAAEPSPVVSGAALMMSRAGFEQLEGFDEGYFLHVEDIDICQRARQAGGEVAFEPRAPVMHYGSTSQVSLLKVELHKARGLIRYFFRNCHPALAAASAPLIWTAVMARALFLEASGRLRAALRRIRLRRLRVERQRARS